MKFTKSIFVIFLLICGFNCVAANAQKTSQSKQIKILNNYGHIPFEDGKTTIVEVSYVGFDSDYEQYDEKLMGNKLPKSNFLEYLKYSKKEIKANDKFSGVKVAKAVKFIKEMIRRFGYLNLEVIAYGEMLPKDRMNLIFSVKRGNPAFISEIRFDGNINVSSEELGAEMMQCLGNNKIYIASSFNYCSHENLLKFLFSKGFFKAKIHSITPRRLANSYVAEISLEEGIRYVYGTIKVNGAKVFTQREIFKTLEVHSGDVADGKKLQTFFGLELKKMYLNKGFMDYDAYFDSEYIEPFAEGLDGTVNITVVIDEGQSFKVRKIKFEDVEIEEEQNLKEIFSLKEDQIYNYTQLQKGIEKINNLNKYIPIEYSLGINSESWTGIIFETDYETSEVDIIISLVRLQ